jgi:pyruvate-ferredoxin/flavodoxin oxidoreductase
MFGAEQQRLAVESGTWPLYRFDPRRVAQGESPLQWDSPPVKAHIGEYMKNEARFRITEQLDAQRFRELQALSKERNERRNRLYQSIASGGIGKGSNGNGNGH